jgi:flavin reductase (DIM6/NTAB) family NADH-FMN oxidoreductase RutF
MSPVEPHTFRDALSQLAGGVVIVTTVDENGSPRGMTATAVCSVSLSPPMVMACMGHAAATHAAVERSGVFALNVLPHTAAGLAARFAAVGDDKFHGIDTLTGETGAPLLVGSLVHCDCVVERSVPAGDHTIFIGRVVTVGTDPAGHSPLLYFRGAYGSVTPLRPDPGPDT